MVYIYPARGFGSKIWSNFAKEISCQRNAIVLD